MAHGIPLMLYNLFHFWQGYIFTSRFLFEANIAKIKASFTEWLACQLSTYIFESGMCPSVPLVRSSRASVLAGAVGISSAGIFLMIFFIFDKVYCFVIAEKEMLIICFQDVYLCWRIFRKERYKKQKQEYRERKRKYRRKQKTSKSYFLSKEQEF